MKNKLLVIDDEVKILRSLKFLLGDCFDVYTSDNSSDALDIIKKEDIYLVLLDLRLKGDNGFDLMEKLLEKQPQAIIIMMTAYSTIENSIKAIKSGAYYFITKPINNDQLLILLHTADEKLRMYQKIDSLEGHLKKNIIGESPAIKQINDIILRIKDTNATILITGESGTGKELVAEALHLAGDRSRKPLVKVNCSALPEALLEAELFGHVKGAFTGAIRDNEGRFCRADGGTIFFDEIGELSPQIQVKLLRVLEESEFERVGSSTSVKVNVRLIAATNRDLQEKVRLGEIRADLYYRLKVVEIRLPPLRDRREDIPLLLEHFRAKFNTQFKKQIEAVSADVLKAFTRYPWPGNVRELEHTMEHAFVLCNQNIITLDHLPTDFLRLPGMRRAAGKAKQDDALATLAALNKTAWNKAKAARLLGVDRVTLYRRIKKFNLSQEPAPS